MNLATAPVSSTADVGLGAEGSLGLGREAREKPARSLFGFYQGFGETSEEYPRVLLVWSGTRHPRHESFENATGQGEPPEIDVFFPERLGNATAEDELLGEIVKALFKKAKDIVFEDGMETEFSKELVQLVRRHSKAAVEVITALIINENVDPEVASEALRWLGRIDHPPSYRDRLWLLERSLFCSSTLVRDGAVLGLASLDDPQAIPSLKRAVEQEKCIELRKDMGQVLEQLESTRQCRFS